MPDFMIEICGRTCKLTMEDKGKSVPGWRVVGFDDEEPIREEYRAYTTYFRIEVPPDMAPPDKFPTLEGYSQANAGLADIAECGAEKFREGEDAAVLDAMLQTLGAKDSEIAAIFKMIGNDMRPF